MAETQMSTKIRRRHVEVVTTINNVRFITILFLNMNYLEHKHLESINVLIQYFFLLSLCFEYH